MCPKGFARLYLSKAEGEESCEFYHGFGGGGGRRLAQSTLTSEGAGGISKGATGNRTLGKGPPSFSISCPQKTAPLATRENQLGVPSHFQTDLSNTNLKGPSSLLPMQPKGCVV